MSSDPCSMRIFYENRLEELNNEKKTTQTLYHKCMKTGTEDECTVFKRDLHELKKEIDRCHNLQKKKTEECRIYNKYRESCNIKKT